MTMRDEYNLCETYFSAVLFLKFYSPTKLSKIMSKYLINGLIKHLSFDINEDNQFCKLAKLKSLLKKNLFIQFAIDFDNFSIITNKNNNNAESLRRQKTLNLISYKQKLFNTSYLYDSDDSKDNFDLNDIKQESLTNKITNGNGVACDYIINKFQDFILYKMTNHIINQSGMISTDRIVNAASNNSSNTIDLLTRSNDEDLYKMDEEQKELADVDQIKFERLKLLYENNMEYFSNSKFRKSNISNEVVQQTKDTILVFLTMLNHWKLRKFDCVINIEKLSNSKNR